MREVDLDIAGEFLVMASTLAHIKSRLLLPREQAPPEPSDEGAPREEDPREELVRRLLEYQKYKAAAELLGGKDILERDVFPRRVPVEAIPLPEEDSGLVEISVYRLIEALDRVLEAAAPMYQHEVVRERLSLSEAIRSVAARISATGETSFFSLFEERRTRQQIVITFLAILEMAKLRLIRIVLGGDEPPHEIVLIPRGDALEGVVPPKVDDIDYK